MVCTAKDLLEWNDFPKGLRVILLDKDADHASEIRSKLEQMDYIVSTFCNEDEALSAVLSESEVFHVAIVEVSEVDLDGNFKFPQMAKSLPTIMAGSAPSLTTTMKCIELGAVEVLNKPISDDKLRNIWQHVVHKAYNAAGSPEECKIPMVKDRELEDERLEEIPLMSDGHDYSSGNDKYPAPSTPQLKQKRIMDETHCDDQTNWSAEKDYEETKSVETTCCNAAPDTPVDPEPDQLMHVVKGEIDSADGPETSSLGGNARTQTNASESHGPCGPKTSRKKMKVDWTPDLHKKFLQAVDQLGLDQAIPSRILNLMKVDGLTRHNVASHLQKYRMQRRHSAPRKEDRRISPRLKNTMPSSYYYQHNPIMPFPHHPMRVQPGACSPSGPPYHPWPWKSYPALQADAWGCPVIPSLHGSYSYYPQSASGCYSRAENRGRTMPSISHDADEVIDKIVKEAISKPWLPLPLGLKPPSTESVLLELYKNGISDIPPTSSLLI